MDSLAHKNFRVYNSIENILCFEFSGSMPKKKIVE